MRGTPPSRGIWSIEAEGKMQSTVVRSRSRAEVVEAPGADAPFGIGVDVGGLQTDFGSSPRRAGAEKARPAYSSLVGRLRVDEVHPGAAEQRVAGAGFAVAAAASFGPGPRLIVNVPPSLPATAGRGSLFVAGAYG